MMVVLPGGKVGPLYGLGVLCCSRLTEEGGWGWRVPHPLTMKTGGGGGVEWGRVGMLISTLGSDIKGYIKG